MNVWVVYVPQDYDWAELVGVYTSPEIAEQEVKKQELGKGHTVRIQRLSLQ